MAPHRPPRLRSVSRVASTTAITLALAACTIQIPDPASSTLPVTVGTATTPPPLQTCASLATAKPAGQFTSDPPIDEPLAPVDVFVSEAEQLPTGASTGHTYGFGLSFTTTPNACAYRSIGAKGPSETTWGFGVTRSSDVPLAEPFPVGIYTGDGGQAVHTECFPDGGGSAAGTDLGEIQVTITITRRDAATVEGAFIVTEAQDPATVLHEGTFKAPLCGAAPAVAALTCCSGS